MKYFKLFLILIVLLSGTEIKEAFSQDNTLYNMRKLPQYTRNNIARQPDCNIYVGFPAISSVYTDFVHTGFTFKDAIIPDPNRPDSFMLDLPGLEAAMNEKNYLKLTQETALLEFGFRLPQRYYFTFAINARTDATIQYPRSLIETRKGNYRQDGSPLSYKFGFDTKYYHETAIGLSKELFNDMTIGARVKILTGIAGIEARDIGVDWYTNTAEDGFYEYTFTTDMQIRTANMFAGADASNLSAGDTAAFNDFVEEFETSGEDFFDNQTSEFEKGKYGSAFKYLFGENLGLGIDLGFDWDINEQFNVSVAVNDLGFIKWKTNPIQAQHSGDFEFSGIDVGKYITSYDQIASGEYDFTEDLQNDMTDSLLNFVAQGDFSNEEFSTNLSSKVFIGGTYAPVKWFDLGLLYRGLIYNKSILSAGTVSANLHFMRGWGLSASYTARDGLYNNIGLGLVMKFGPFQFYAVSDHIAPMFWTLNDSEFAEKWIRNTKRFSFHTGLNFTLCGGKKDRPLLD